MNRQWQSVLRILRGQQRQRPARRCHPQLETLENRLVPSTAPFDHVLLLSVDGLHAADVADPALAPVLTNTLQLQGTGVTYTNAHTTSPSDSFPGTLSYLTGALPGTTGVFYDDSYSRTLLAPGSAPGATPGTEVTYFEAIDKNPALISGGGNFDASSIDPSLLPIDPKTNQVVYPNQFLQANTIFDVAHNAGLYTAFSDKHPAYQIANGTNPAAINDFYGPEINSTTGLLDNTTGKTVNADNLLFGASKVVSGVSVAPGFTLSSFATNPTGSSQPDSIAVDGINIYVGYGNGVAKDGSDGKSSTIVQYDTAGNIVQMFSVLGHNDGLKVDPSTHLLWALQNEDGNPNLVVIDPVAGTATPYTIAAVNGGGYDDITFVGGKVYFSASNPANNPNTDPAVVQVTLSGSTAMTTPILFGNATATNLATNTTVTLNLQDPDSMTADGSGNLVLDSQADNEIVTIHKPGTAGQSVTVVSLTDAANLLPGHGVDDTLFTPSAHGEIVVTDRSGAIYLLRGPGVNSSLVLSAAQDSGELGTLNPTTGKFTPIVSGLGSPRGLAFVNAGPFMDLSNYTLVDASTDPMGASDPNLINDTTHNVLLTEKYDDLKVQAILNEIHGLPSHTFPGSNNSQVPAIFGMNFQAVSVAEKDHNGGIQLLPNGQEGNPSTLLEGAMQHTDESIGLMTGALNSQGLSDSTMVVLTAKHGQAPRVGEGGLMKGGTLSDLLAGAGATVAQATEDDVSLLWLQNQSQTAAAVAALQAFQQTGTIDVYFNGVKQTMPASQIIDKILSGKDLVKAGLGNPAKDSTTPDIVVVLKPGFIWVGNPKNFAHKNAEHGGFSDDDTHVTLIVSSPGLLPSVQGRVVKTPVETRQIAVSTLLALGLDPKQLTGAVADNTKKLPGLKLKQLAKQKEKANQVLQNIDHFVVIYQENWSFDSLYGLFPGANGLKNAVAAGTIPQVDKSGNPITTLPNPSTDPLVPGVAGLPAHPFNLAPYVPVDGKTSDIIHRFYHEQLQIDNGVLQPSNGSMDKFVTWSDNGSMVFSYFDATNLPEGKLAQQYTLDDNFFHAAYGGSFLNHQWLVAAATPQWNQPIPAGFQSSWDPVTQTLHDNNLTIDGKYDVNTTFGLDAPHPAGTPAKKLLNPINDNHPALANGQPDPTYIPTIGDRLDAGGLSWNWFSGGWTNALQGNPDPLFQFHHQPLAYYANYAPLNPDGTQNPQTSSLLNPNAHLQDETQFFVDAANGTLPAVSFIKPLGPDNEHPGYTDLLTGQQHVADIVHAVQNSPDWAHTAIVITYDENGGRWDQVSPPTRDQWGDGTRVPAIVISPFAKQGFVDHQEHDTLSILSTIEARFGLQPLNQADANASTLSVDFQKHPNASFREMSEGEDSAGQDSGGAVLGVSGTNSFKAGVGPDIVAAATNAGAPAKLASSSGSTANNSFASSVWAAGAQWLSPSQGLAIQAARTLQATGQQTGGLGINWDVFGPELVKAI